MTASDYALVAARIRKMAEFGKSIKAVGLSQRAIVALLVEATGLPKRDIKLVLDGIEGLHNWVAINSNGK